MHIELFVGPMFSGKTTELIRRITTHVFAGKKCLVIKFAQDTRYSKTKIVSHNKQSEYEAFNCSSKIIDSLNELKLDSFDVIGIDEAQFFEDVAEIFVPLSDSGKTIIVSGLDADKYRKPFGKILDIAPFSDQIIKLNAVCGICKKARAAHSLMKGQTIDDPKHETEISIGGNESYFAICTKCRHDYFEKLKK